MLPPSAVYKQILFVGDPQIKAWNWIASLFRTGSCLGPNCFSGQGSPCRAHSGQSGSSPARPASGPEANSARSGNVSVVHPNSPVPLLDWADEQSANARMGVNFCRPGLLAATGRKDNHICHCCPTAPPTLAISAFSFCTSLCPVSSGSVNIYCSCLLQNDAGKKVQDLELELSKRQAERDHFSAHNQELQKQLAQSQEGTTSPFQPTESILSHWKGFLIPHRGTVLQCQEMRGWGNGNEHEIWP